MRQLVLFFLVIVGFYGCSTGEDDNQKFHLEMLPVLSAEFPSEFKKNVTYDIPIKFVRPSTCHLFNGFYYYTDSNVRTIAVQSSVIEQDNCVPASTIPLIQILKFKPISDTSYEFRLWKGKGASGLDVYEIITIPVIQ
jgi:hypothetical protein